MFSRPLQLKHDTCSFCGQPPQELHPYVNIFVRVTNRCPANCAFCSNMGNRQQDMGFDEDKLFRIIDELIARDIYVKRLNITGGEPSVVAPRVKSLLSRLADFPYSFIHAHLNTIGIGEAARELMMAPRWDSISISLHHYDKARRCEMYRLPHLEDFSIPAELPREKLNASCNLVRGYVDNESTTGRMMSYALRLGFPRLGFVSLMKTNEYCRHHAVDYTEVAWEKISGLSFIGDRARETHCRCRNYLYREGEKVLEIYMRHCLEPKYADSSLLFDGLHLYQGFGKGAALC